MTTTEHTPTPWKGPCEPSSNFDRRYTVKNRDGETVAIMVGKERRTRANAAFIVRACNNIERVEAENAELRARNDELVKALSLALEALTWHDGLGFSENGLNVDQCARAALAKAQEVA